MRKLVIRWIYAVAELDDEACQAAVNELKAARADRMGDHWYPLEFQAFERCVQNGCLATPDIRASVLHAQLSPLYEEYKRNG